MGEGRVGEMSIWVWVQLLSKRRRVELLLGRGRGFMTLEFFEEALLLGR